MTQFTCAHCGRPVHAGNLCPDCQALRAYHPDVFFAQNASAGAGIDKTVIFAVSSVVVLALLVGISWPFLKKSIRPEKTVARKLPPVVSNFQPTSQSDIIFTPTRTYNLPVTNQQTFAPRQDYTPPAGQRLMPAPTPPTQVSTVPLQGDNTQMAQQSLSAFIASYCAQESQQSGLPVRSTGISMMMDGVGAQLTFDEGGNYRQGTAQFAGGAWTWLQHP